MPKRILDYEVEIVESALNNKIYLEENEEMPIVIPIVIYTGKTRWNVTGYLEDCRRILNPVEAFRLGNYYIIDVNNYTKEDLLNDDLFISKLMLLEKSKTTQDLYKNYKEIISIEKSNTNLKMLDKMLEHIYQRKLGEKYTKELKEKLIEERGEEDMILEMIDKENESLINKGKKEGKRESLINVAKRMLKENMDIDFITKITGLKKEQFMK